MTLTGMIPRHGAEIVRITVVPTLTAAERISWIAAREWPIVGALAALVAICAFGPRLGPAELDPLLVAGYVGGLFLTRHAARAIRASVVRLELVVRR
ncbi:MAG: hypothetical protein M3N46_10425 [Actinomycetota bacterium]|nr:hypothetical protein [Actinomycetota bacterium]